MNARQDICLPARAPARHALLLALLLALPALLGAVATVCAAQGNAPQEVAGLRLGEPAAKVADAKSRLDMAGAMPLWRQEYLRRVGVRASPGFESGSVDLGNCREKGVILRIKLKYMDASDSLFNRLLAELERRYGRGEWRGDAFGSLKTWKWGLTDANGDSISLILQHYTGRDESQTPGNSIRLANRSALERERLCARARPSGSSGAAISAPQPQETPGLEGLLPR